MSFKNYEVDIPKVAPILTVAQKKIIIDGFAENLSERNIKRKDGIKLSLIVSMFSIIESIENYASRCMSGLDEESSKITSFVVLLKKVSEQYPEQTSIIKYLLTKMVKYTKVDGSGDWELYLSQFEG